VNKELPVVAQYCATFLKPEMHHIYRQINALETWRPVVITQKREQATVFPFPPADLRVVPKPALHWLRRWWCKQVRDVPILLFPDEARRLRDTLHAMKARALHVYFGHIGVHLLPLLRILELPVVVSFHGADAGVDMEKPPHANAMREVFERARLILVRTEAMKQDLAALGCPIEKLRIHRTGIPLDAFPFQPRTIPPDGAWRLLQAGRLIEKKGYDTTLHAFREIAASHAKARLTIAGEGPLDEKLRALATELGLRDKVTFTGFVTQEELRRLLAEAHLFLHPSRTARDGNREGIPNALLEAMASGLPVFATRHGGISEAATDGIEGRLVAEGDHGTLARSVLGAMENPENLAEMGASASARVRRDFESCAQARVLASYYDTLIQP